MFPLQPIQRLNARHTTMHSPPPSLDDRRMPSSSYFIGADTNASIGRARGNLSDNDNDIKSLNVNVVGSFGIERITYAGRRLRVLMETHQIAALSTFFNSKKFYSTCWTHPDPVSKCSYQNQIDHVFTFRENLRHFSDAGSVSGN